MRVRTPSTVAIATLLTLAACGDQAVPRSPAASTGSPGAVPTDRTWIGGLDQDGGGCSFTPGIRRTMPGRAEITARNRTNGPGAFDLFRIGPGGTLEGLNAVVYQERARAEAGEPFIGPPGWTTRVAGTGSMEADGTATLTFDARPGMYAAVCLSAYAETADPIRPAFLAGPIMVSEEAPAPRAGIADTFVQPFSYELPAHSWIDWHALSDHVQGALFENGEAGGVAVWAVEETLEDSCLPRSGRRPLEGGAAGLVEYIRSLPAVEIVDESTSEIDGRDAVTLDVHVEDTGCTARVLNLWPDSSHPESDWTLLIHHGGSARLHVFEVAGSVLAIEEFGIPTSWADTANALIGSLHFEEA